MPFGFSDGIWVLCHEGLQTSCIHGGSPRVLSFSGAAERVSE